MASPSPGDRGQAGHSVKRDRRRIYCNHCKKEVRSRRIIGKRQHLDSESELSDDRDCNDDPNYKFLWSDNEEIDVIISDHTSAVENSAPLIYQ